MRVFLILAFALVPLASAGADDSKRDPNVARIKTSGGEAEIMADAVRQARATLPAFFALADKPRPGTRNFALKIGLPTPDGDEFVWIRPFTRNGKRIVGELRNEPVGTKAIRMGQRIAFEEKDVADWSYLDGDTLRGNFTGCAIAGMKPAHERADFVRRNRLDCSFL